MLNSLNVLDYVFIAITLMSVIFGIIKGFIRELFSLAFFILAVILAFLFYHEVGELFIKSLKNRDVANFAGFITIFTTLLIVGTLITFFIKKIFTVGPLKGVDRILGGVFGLVRGILISGVLVFGLIAFPIDKEMISKSRLSPYIAHTVGIFYDFLPKKFKNKLDAFKKELGEIPNKAKGKLGEQASKTAHEDLIIREKQETQQADTTTRTAADDVNGKKENSKNRKKR